jgi:hypothetical protein
MDPSALGGSEWSEIGKLMTNLWLVVLFVVLFASNMLLGHNFIPSLVASQHVPRAAQKARPLFYLLAIISFALAVFFLVRVIDLAGVLRRIWESYWI